MFRRNKGKLIFDRYTKKISSIFSIDISMINFLSLEESDMIRKYPFNYFQMKSDVEMSESLMSKLTKQLKKLGEAYYVFIDDDWEYCGCFQISSLNLIKDTFRFGLDISDNLVFINESITQKIVLDYYEMNNKYYLESEIYGLRLLS